MPNPAMPQMSDAEQLELQAARNRVELHHSFTQLRERIHAAQEKYRPSNYLRDHRTKAMILAAVVGTLSGYGVAGMFTRH